MRTMILAAVLAALFGSPAAAQAQSVVTTQVQVDQPDGWRYKWHNNQWWYYSPEQRWLIHDGTAWHEHNPALVSSGSGATYFRGTSAYPYQTNYRGYGNGTTYYNGNNQYYGGAYGNGYGQTYGNGQYYGNGYYGNGYGRSYYGNGYGRSYNYGSSSGLRSSIGGAILGRALGLGF